MTNIPYDMYESSQELVIIVPFGGVDKSSITISIKHEIISISGIRHKPVLRKDFQTLQQLCYWGEVSLSIDLPPYANYKQIHSTLSKDNILTLVIPKNLIPDHIPLKIEEE